LKEESYKLEDTDYNPNNFNLALQKSLEWDDKIPTGIFYKAIQPTYEELVLRGKYFFGDTTVPDITGVVNELIIVLRLLPLFCHRKRAYLPHAIATISYLTFANNVSYACSNNSIPRRI